MIGHGTARTPASVVALARPPRNAIRAIRITRLGRRGDSGASSTRRAGGI